MTASEHTELNTVNDHKSDSESDRSLAQLDSLLVSADELSFTQTAPDKPAFLILTIKQQTAIEPVTLTTDAPAYFQLASDKRPAFLPTLTLMPDTAGTHVHVRYFSSKTGKHEGQLIIQNSLETKYVGLTGRHAGLFPTFQRRRLPVIKAAESADNQPRRFFRQSLLLLLIIPILLGIAYAAFTYYPRQTSAIKRTIATMRRNTRQNDKQEKQPVLIVDDKNQPAATPKKVVPTTQRPSNNEVYSTDEEDEDHLSTDYEPEESSLNTTNARSASDAGESVVLVDKRADLKKADKGKLDEQPTKKRSQKAAASDATRDTSSSELERILNHPRR